MPTTPDTETTQTEPPPVWPPFLAGQKLAEEITRVTAMPRPAPTACVLAVSWQALGVYALAGRALAATHNDHAEQWRSIGAGAA